ncbi:MAG: Lrp/AsnC family transcriptional regulator [Rhodobacteraceae bacterium]|nr:Lrp/AsnC family transcriptional regulator [Paracoccaceae bacterium]
MIDLMDARLMRLLQENAQQTAQELSAQVHMSASQLGRRRARLETAGVITGYGARLDAGKLGLGVQAFVQIQLAAQGPEPKTRFESLIESQPEIVAAWSLTGKADYLLRLYCRSLEHLNTILHEVLLARAEVGRVHSRIVMQQVKKDAPLPVAPLPAL